MTRTGRAKRRMFVLDTNVLMHDPTAIFRFEEHDIFIPMIVLEELDAGKKGLSEAARNVRQVSRFLDELMQGASKADIDRGLSLPTAATSAVGASNGSKSKPSGRLFFQTQALNAALPELPGNGADNAILGQALALKRAHADTEVTLVSKDINLRIKAAILGVHAEDYFNDQTIEDADLLHTGTRALAADFWEKNGADMESWKDHARTFYKLRGPAVSEWHPNLCIYEDTPNGVEAIVRSVKGNEAVLELLHDYRSERHTVWGITARNREQNFALNLLMDPEIDFVTVLGPAGTGKTLLTLAAGLAQTLDSRRFSEDLVRGVKGSVGELDALLTRCSRNWRLERMSWVDRNLLRLASYELSRRSDTPARVAINEAIEVAKRYGTTESPAFINGVLDRVLGEIGRASA